MLELWAERRFLHDMDSDFGVAIAVVTLVALGGAFHRFMTAKVTPDPWDGVPAPDPMEIEETPVCLRCLEPKPDHLNICPHCGSATDAAARMVEFPSYLTLGDVFRSGVDPSRKRGGAMMTIGYVTLAFIFCLPLAPFYWWRLARTRATQNKPISEDETPAVQS